ncbi:hypothetical protein AFK66_018650 [Cronobacter malonaticus LMG 23826]|nr:hypothetical protein AFK66_018650 [Cronobacter malonaticus LMG 23826]
MRVAERKPGDHRDYERAEIEPRKRSMLRHRMRLHQAFVAHHADSKTDIRQLHQQQPGPEVIAHFVIANNRRADDRKPGAKRVAPAQPTAAQQIVNQRDIERRKHRKQQKFRDGQVEIRPEAEQVHHTQLQCAHQHIERQRFQALPAGA